jgi:hypothetical protein
VARKNRKATRVNDDIHEKDHPMISLKLSVATASMAIAQKGWIMSVIMSDQVKVTMVAAIPGSNCFTAGII